MALLPENLYSVAQTRELDRLAIEAGTPAIELMQRAGHALLRLIQEKYPGAQRLLVVCGGGNNGGDGYVLARLALQQGLLAHVLPLVAAKDLRGEAAEACRQWQGVPGAESVDRQAFAEPGYDVVVDAMLGTGISRDLEGEVAELVAAINAYPAKVVAADLPTGVNADTGAIHGCAVKAQMTLSFVGLKQGLLTGSAPDYTGEVYFNDLGIPRAVSEALAPAGQCVQQPWVNARLVPRPRSTHKGRCGHVLIIGGNRGMSGAALMAGQSALRAGAGLVSIATRQGHAASLNLTQPELMCHGVSELKPLQALIEQATVIAIGPGLGQDTWAQELFKAAMASQKPLVVDADALNLLAQEYLNRGQWVLTPHPGEAARLAGQSTGMVQRSRFQSAQALAEHYNATVVLKGVGSIIAHPGQPFLLSDRGNPGMASGGMGDCLTGIVAGLIAQGLSLRDAAACACYLHGQAADRVAKVYGERGMAATDLLEPLRKLVNP